MPILNLQLLDFHLKHQNGCILTAASPKNGRKIQIIACETSKLYLLQTFLFWTSFYDNSLFLSPLTKKRVIYLKRKLCLIVNEYSIEIGSISVMRAYVIKRVPANFYGSPCTYCERVQFSLYLTVSFLCMPFYIFRRTL